MKCPSCSASLQVHGAVIASSRGHIAICDTRQPDRIYAEPNGLTIFRDSRAITISKGQWSPHIKPGVHGAFRCESCDLDLAVRCKRLSPLLGLAADGIIESVV